MFHSSERSGRGRAPALLLAFIVSACNRPAPDGAAAQHAGPVVLAPEAYVSVKRERIESGPALSGSLEARQRAVMRAEVGGSVGDVRVELGDAVKRGHTLARIDDQAQRDVVTSAESAVASAEQEVTLARRQL